jgi:import inner membrane translocase subunit TIM44
MKSRPVLLKAMRLRQQAIVSPRAELFRPAVIAPSRLISTSTRLLNESKQSGEKQQQKQEKQQQQKTKPPPSPEENSAPQSPFKIFAQVLKEEIAKNKGWQDNVKQLQGDVDKLADSEAMKRARDIYERARVSRLTLLYPGSQYSMARLMLMADHKYDSEQPTDTIGSGGSST